MQTGDCFHCHQPGHWAKNCPLKTTTVPTAAVSPPVIHCPCNGGVCNVFTSKTEENPNRRFYKCPSCGYFKWCDQESIIKPESISNFGACGFFKLEDDVQTLPKSEQLGNVKRSRLGVVVESDLNPSLSNESTLGNRVVGRIAQPVKDTLPMNAITVGKESNPVFAGFNNRKLVSNGNVPSFDLITLYEDAEEQILPSLAPKHLEPQVETLCSDLLKCNSKASYASEEITGVSQNTGGSVSNGKTKPDHKHQSTISGETGASFSGSSSLMDLMEQYNSEKLHFKNVSLKYVDTLTAFTDSYKQLKSLRDRAHSLSEVEKQMKFCEAETSEFAMRLQEVSGEMAKLQNKMLETTGKVAKEKQRDFAAP
ncbi:hypothetical protein CARUB_v10021297mg [Capsella rubella]|uniref:Uncharacterized protein n=1 Tax=Capsella rubella TaxID=81985 RepID=R0GDW2_9BRAS|nr:hypothetical protein CARUB_v10021297mg [Capsella rubella]